MKIENFQINNYLTNGMIGIVKNDPDFMGTVIGFIDRGFKVKFTPFCSVIFLYSNISIIYQLFGDDAIVAICKKNTVIKKIVKEKFDLNALEIKQGALIYNNKEIVRTN